MRETAMPAGDGGQESALQGEGCFLRVPGGMGILAEDAPCLEKLGVVYPPPKAPRLPSSPGGAPRPMASSKSKSTTKPVKKSAKKAAKKPVKKKAKTAKKKKRR